jgi:hypothetical protein
MYAASVEVGGTVIYFAWASSAFAMQDLSRDNIAMDPGIKKTTWIDLNIQNQRSRELDGYEILEEGRSFVSMPLPISMHRLSGLMTGRV